MLNILSYTSRAGYARQTKPLENCVFYGNCLSTQKLCVVQADKLAQFSHLSTWHLNFIFFPHTQNKEDMGLSFCVSASWRVLQL